MDWSTLNRLCWPWDRHASNNSIGQEEVVLQISGTPVPPTWLSPGTEQKSQKISDLKIFTRL
jgi:hypothetical protein